MKMLRVILLPMLMIIVSALNTQAVVLDFEGLSDSISVADSYASEGAYFVEAISLTAGYSLNEIDYPPSSGIVAIGDDMGPMAISFDSPVENIFANFTYATQLTFEAYDFNDVLLGTFVNPGLENYGTTEVIALTFTGVSKLVIAGDLNGASYIMDDLHFDLSQQTVPTNNPVPEPTTMLLLALGIAGIAFIKSRVMHRK